MNGQHSFLSQVTNHAVAIISLIVAISALFYTAWREEETERNRNTRTAAFEVLKNLGELQLIVNNAHYKNEANQLMGWGRIAIISDLAQLLPKLPQQQAEKLVAIWRSNADDLEKETNVDEISQQIDQTRLSVVQSLRSLK